MMRIYSQRIYFFINTFKSVHKPALSCLKLFNNVMKKAYTQLYTSTNDFARSGEKLGVYIKTRFYDPFITFYVILISHNVIFTHYGYINFFFLLLN